MRQILLQWPPIYYFLQHCVVVILIALMNPKSRGCVDISEDSEIIIGNDIVSHSFVSQS